MKRTLSLAELDAQTAVELPSRELMAVGIGAGGLVGIGIAIGKVEVNVPITITDNNICVNVAAVASVAACDQQQD